MFRVKDDTFKYIQHVSTAGAKGELYAPGTRGLLTRQIAHEDMTFPEGSKVVLVRQLPGSTQNAAAFEASIEGNTVTVTTADFSTVCLRSAHPVPTGHRSTPGTTYRTHRCA